MTYGQQSARADRLARSRPPMSQWRMERTRGPILPMEQPRRRWRLWG
jgi:hypothetical protein